MPKSGTSMKMPFRFFKPVLGPIFPGLALLLLAATLCWAATLKVAQPNQRLYPDPDSSSPVLATVPQGAEVQVLRQVGAWYKVAYQGKKGWLEQVAFRLPDLLSPEPVEVGGGEDAVIGGMARRGPGEGGVMAEKAPPKASKPPPAAMSPPAVPKAGKPQLVVPEPFRVLDQDQALYPDPDPAGQPTGRVSRGARVTVVRQVGDWLKVAHQGQTGWLPRQAVKK